MQTNSASESATETGATKPGPVIVAEFPKNKKETLRVSFIEFQGYELLEIRAYYPSADGTLKPGKGVAIQRSQIVTLRKALQQAERALKGEKTVAGATDPDDQAESELQEAA